ncbi:MAG: NAD(P)-dependent alcohol dehydrogenase [Myxococcota bacterium]
MRAVLQSEYGMPELFRLGEVPTPVVSPTGVLVKVRAVAINKGDWHLLTGKPYLMRLVGFGLMRPVQPIPGVSLAGTVEAVGAQVSRFRVGDEVIGEVRRGALAEYALVEEAHLGPKPSSWGFDEASTLPVSATTALQGLRDVGKLQAGMAVLINGAAGGVGVYAIQLARALGAEVTGVCGASNQAFVAGLGAHRVINYAQEDFTLGSARYDILFDLVGNHPVSALRKVMKEGGRIVGGSGGGQNEWLGPFPVVLRALLGNLFSAARFEMLMAMPKHADLAEVSRLADAGQLRPVVERRYALTEMAEALRLQGQGHCRGKSVIVL